MRNCRQSLSKGEDLPEFSEGKFVKACKPTSNFFPPWHKNYSIHLRHNVSPEVKP